jgi:hypothetical protein
MKTILKVSMLAVGGASLGYTLNTRLRLEQAKWESINE